ncbi:MAG TPA: flagellar hook-basal body protein [Solirubrobacterales bacterium]|nr:flagellar hook-basal body protein [Solirubrobacterales bacterium]
MIGALYTAAAGMEAQQHHLDALSNDIANASTSGYKSLRVGFHDLIYQSAGRGAGPGVQTGAGAAAGIIGRNQSQGALVPTERPLDIALEGPGFIRVRGRDGGVALTRDGNLGVDPDGRLRTAGGLLLEPSLKLPPGTDPSEVSIGPDGAVSVGRRRLGAIALLTVANPDGLEPSGDNAFRPTAASGPAGTDRGTTVQQGALEASNVDMADATVAMMNAQRGYELGSRAIQTQDEVLAVANGIKR